MIVLRDIGTQATCNHSYFGRFSEYPFFSTCLIACLLGVLLCPEALLGQWRVQMRRIDSLTYRIEPVVEQARPYGPVFIKPVVPARPRIGLALSGGGARCLSQIGVLQVLQEHDIPLDFIVGTSMGSLIGGLFAAGYSPAEIEKIARSINWRSVLVDRPPREDLFFGQKQNRDRLLLQVRFDGLKPHIPGGFTPGQKVQSLLTELIMQAPYTPGQHFDHLFVPFRAVCTDLYSGKKVVLDHGDLAEAIRASLAFPLLFTAVPWEDKLLVDGGMLDNIPVQEVRKLGADLVIAVDASSGLRPPNQLSLPWEIADQVTTIMQRDRIAESRRQADILVRIDDSERTNMDFSNIDSLIALGRVAMAAQLEKLTQKMQQIGQDDTLPQHAFFITRYEGPLSEPELTPPAANGYGHGRLVTVATIAASLYRLIEAGDHREVAAEIEKTNFGYFLKLIAVENPRLVRVAFTGNTVFPSDTLRAYFTHMLGRPVNYRRTQDALKRIILHYRRAGYSLARIAGIDFKPQSGTGTITIDEGKISSIRIQGIRRTRQFVVSREFPAKPGDIFNFLDAQKGITNIYGTGLFDRVAYTIRECDGRYEILLKLTEKKFTTLGLSARTDSERKSRALLELADENVAGIGARLALQAQYGVRDRGLQSNFSVERIFKTYLRFDGEASFTRQQNFVYARRGRQPMGEYVEKRIGTQISVGQLVERLGIVSIEWSTDRFEIVPVFGHGYPDGVSVISRLTFRSILDTRDRLPYPEEGRYVQFFYELSSKLLNQKLSKNVSFFRTFLSLETFNTLGRRHTINPHFAIGTADLTTPFVYHFRLSGYRHVFGLRDQELIGRHFVLGNLTYRYKLPISKSVTGYLGVRYDTWGIWENPEKASYGDLEYAVGAFFGLSTILGPMEIAYGWASTGQKRFYFSFGPKF